MGNVYDVSDPDGEIAPKGKSDPTKILWDSLDTYYMRLALLREVPTVIMYHVDSILPNTQDERDLWRFLRNDEQAWKRTKVSFVTMDELQKRSVRRGASPRPCV